METSTTTIRTMVSMSGACVAESDYLYSFKNLHDAYLSCRRRKRNTINALGFEERVLDNLFELGAALAEGSYTPSRSVCFIAKQPKHREIFAADFRDRVVHHLLVPRLEEIFEPKFIHDSFACRKGKGTHAAVQRLRQFMNSITRRGEAPAWFLQLDIRSFFMSMDREILLAMLARHVRDPRLMELATLIVRNDCTRDFVYKGDPRLLQAIPPHKSLFHIPKGKGLPIGNLTSQFFGNVYLNELDQFVKHELKAKYYLRYVDDLVLLHTDRGVLVEYLERIAQFIAQRLALELKAEQTIKRVSEGANFLGYIVRPDYSLVRARVVGNLRSRLRLFSEELVQSGRVCKRPHRLRTRLMPPLRNGSHDEPVQTLRSGRGDLILRLTANPPKSPFIKGDFSDEAGKGLPGCDTSIHLHLHEEPVRRLRQTIASYLGHFKHANARTLTRSIFEKYGYLKEIFTLDDDYRIHPRYEPAFTPKYMKEQYGWATGNYGGYCIFFQVGRFCEFYGEQADRYGKFYGLTPQTDVRTGKMKCGFPMRLLQSFKRRARTACMPYIVVGEQGYYPSGLKKRVVTELFRPAVQDPLVPALRVGTDYPDALRPDEGLSEPGFIEKPV